MLVLMWLLAIVAAVIPARLFLRKKLILHRDFFFLFIYAQILVYLHVAPSVYARYIDHRLQETYCWFQAGVILLFELPLIWLYLRAMRKAERVARSYRMSCQVRPERHLALALVSCALAFTYLYVAIKNAVLFHWLGSLYPLVMESLPRWQFFVYRLFTHGGIFLLLVLILSLYFQQKWLARAITVAGVVLVGGLCFVQAAFNSRLDSASVIVLITGIILTRDPKLASLKFKHYTLLFGAILLIAYAARVALIARNNYSAYGVRLDYFNPFWQERTDYGSEPWDWRLNGIDLMALMTEPAWRQGYAWGEAWSDPVYVFFGQLTGARDVSWMKRLFMVDAKYYFLVNYVNVANPTMDYPSVMLTDLYGNFGLLGFLLGVPLLALPCAYAAQQIRSPTSTASLALAGVLLLPVLKFENEAIGMFFSFLRFMPLAAVVVILQPWRIARSRVPLQLLENDSRDASERMRRSPLVPQYDRFRTRQNQERRAQSFLRKARST